MRTVQLNKVKNPVTQLIMGSDYFHPDRLDEVKGILQSYLDIGGNTIDTAFIYAGGESEKAIGLAVEQNGWRDRFNLWTKGAHPNQQGSTVTKHDIDEQLKISLDRLRTESVELYALHRDDTSVPVGAILEWLNEHVEAGRIGSFGGSNWTTARLQEANQYAEKNGLQGFSFSSPNLSLAKAKEPYWADCLSVDNDILNWHNESKLPIFSWSSQARGFFTGRFTRDNFENEDLVRVFYNDENWERYDRAEALAKDKGLSTIQIALAYVLNQKFPTAAIIGPQNEAEMKSCGEGAGVSLSEEEIQWLNLDSSTRPS
ncbi:aldo/keto reductase [Aureibacillus halotolerans]|uniref:Aryl-alcohol dehydrogenase-like predicted oxidoreductase n=1 Tax=Aureibacillus halotolerans TaxID=1508390 RepID=A0A4R6U716_9BACI|nr:aldo/keto reductase [Aureibacillus halotolerans]TDQ40335.1 aryl-alcohol dehydrogenase-like predicted oxidoreductase [Aureibacillus halotolerans]